MKTSTLIALLTVGSSLAFIQPSRCQRSTKLNSVDRRQFGEVAIVVGAAAFVGAEPAFAARGKDYVPKFDDLKLIYGLGTSLDNLAQKFSNEATIEAGLEGVRIFNRDPAFYPGYAKNFVSKSVLNNADADPRIGYIRQACTLIGSTQSLLEGGAGLVEGDATKEALRRVQKAQAFIGKFLAESGVQTAEVDAYVKAHPLS